MVNDDMRKNSEGYSDPTICELSGFHIEERIIVKDKKTGRIWK